jgi:hypothetical protein
MTAVYEDPVNDDWPMLALYVDGPMLRLYDETSVYYIGVEKPCRRGLVWRRSGLPGAALRLHVHRTPRPQPRRVPGRRGSVTGCCSTARRFGIVEPLIPIQQRVRRDGVRPC